MRLGNRNNMLKKKELPENVESKVHSLYSLFTILPSLIHNL